MSTGTADQNTADVAGMTKYVVRRHRSVETAAGVAVANWNAGSSSNPSRQSDVHFNGRVWVACGLNAASTSTVRDSTGKNSYNNCDNADTGDSLRTSSLDVSGVTMAKVLTDARAAGYTNLSLGDNSTSTFSKLLGTSIFPAGSELFYQETNELSHAIQYYPGTGNYVKQYSAQISAGGIASTQAAGTGCNAAEFNGDGTDSTTLEGMMAAFKGTPCIFSSPARFTYDGVVYTSPDATNESWGGSALNIGTIGNAPVGTGPAPGFYTSNTKVRVAFTGNGPNAVTYYSCKERFNTGATRNCTTIGTGSYTITTRGDARTLQLNNPPALADSFDYQRVFVERDGKIYFGYQYKLGKYINARLNTVASRALLAQLVLPAVDPDVPLALTKASYAGTWEASVSGFPLESTLLQIFLDGTTSCADVNYAVLPAVTTPRYACDIVFTNLADGSFTMKKSDGGINTGKLNFLTGAITGNYVKSPTSSPIAFAGNRR